MKVKLISFSTKMIDYRIKRKRSKKNGRVYNSKVKIKKPYLIIDARIKAYADCILGGVYVCNNGYYWMCTEKLDLMQLECTLVICKTAPYKKFILPTDITYYGTSVSGAHIQLAG